MRAMVTRLAPLQKPSPEELGVLTALGEDAAEPGMYYLIDDDTQAIVEPAWLYLLARYRFIGRRTEENPEPSFADNRQTAYQLAEWLNFVHAIRRDWRKVDHETIIAFVTYQNSRVSPHSGKRREHGTIGAKTGTVYSFYNYTNGIRVTDVKWDAESIAAVFRSKRKRRHSEDDEIRPFGVDEVPAIRKALGPLPSELKDGSTRPTRDRLLFETAILTGMRGEELCYLRSSAIAKLKPDANRPNATLPLRIQITKGRVHRTVMIPNRVIIELQAYIEGERRRGVRRWSKKNGRDHGYLFVNYEDASKPGGQLKTNTIHRRFAALMRKLKFTTETVRTIKGEQFRRLIPNHGFHDTRHTFAVRFFVGLKRQLVNDPGALNYAEPWEVVQIALGHADWHTTRKHYLRHVGEYEAEISDRVHEWLGDL